MRIRQMPAGQRPRERLLRDGVAALGDAELLALFLRTGIRGCDALALAGQLLDTHQGLAGLMSLDAAAMTRARGLGPAKASQLIAALELARRYVQSQLRHESVFSDPTRAGEFVALKLRQHPNEVFAVAFLDAQYRLLAFEELFRGSISSTEVHPREILRRALAHNAAAVILAHNHPSGLSEPSPADRMLTARVAEALALIGVRVLDHLIVGHGRPTSLAERGML
jgi:DNA repair protein RadC